jgi:GDPmannose 4,6-dehydratase
MLQCDRPDNFVIASGATDSLEEFVSMAFAEVGLNWRDRVIQLFP